MARPAGIGMALVFFVLGTVACPALQAASCAVRPATRPYDDRSFLGYACRDAECAAHKAGFAWADRHGISDPVACVEAEDATFVEGCRAFAELGGTAEQSGFEWARDNEVSDDCLCTGAGPRFAAGCEAYVGGFGRRSGAEP
jgi:hypothetical protein